MSELTKQQRHINRKYLAIEKWYTSLGGSHRVSYTVGVQKFTVACGTRGDCRWLKPLFAIALSNMVDEMKSLK